MNRAAAMAFVASPSPRPCAHTVRDCIAPIPTLPHFRPSHYTPKQAFEVHDVQKFPMTVPGLLRLEEELRTLKSIERPAVIRAIAEARTHGDLSENAEYHAARERQSFIEGRIGELEEIVSSVEVIDPSTLSGDHVKFGAVVKLIDEETDKEATYQIVGVHEADVKAQRLSISSPLAKALIGKKAGDTISVPAPGGDRSYEILSVQFR